MNRLKLTSALLLIWTLMLCVFCGCSFYNNGTDHDSSSRRVKYNFNYDWKFNQADPLRAESIDFNDSLWQTVSCPHTFNDVDTFDDFSLGHHDGEENQWRGTVWYRKHFQLPKSAQEKIVIIEFESVRQIADVYVNGIFLGKNQTGFIPFGYNLTPYLHFDGTDNVIAVKVNNDRGDNFRNNSPLVWNHEHWHPTHGGIYRNVFLHVLDKLHITLPLFDNMKTVGTYVSTSNVSQKSADVLVESEIQNGYDLAQTFTYEVAIYDHDGDKVTSSSKVCTVGAKEKQKIGLNVSVTDPILWYTRHPYLYKVISSVSVGDNVVDSEENCLGIRSFEFNKDTGFHINGEHTKLHGWGQKPTNSWAGLGAALPDWLREYTYQMMDEAGGNFIRWGHCAGSPSEISFGDRYGFVTLMPGVSGESEDHGDTWRIRLDAFRDMIVYYRNHPSIFIWEGGNWAETDEHFEAILDVIDTYDPYGKRLMGNRRADLKEGVEKYVSIEVGTEGWEGELHDLPIIESEYCRDESPRRQWDRYTADDNFFEHPNFLKNTYKLTSEQFAVRQATHWWNKMGKKPYHSGGANWIFSDGPHGGRCPTEVTRASGEVDAVRLPKEAFYALKAMWRPEPQVHIVGHWNYNSGVRKTMYVVSNCEEVKLLVNGKTVGSSNEPTDGYVFTFPNVTWEKGEVSAKAYLSGAEVISQTKQTAGDPDHIKLTPITSPQGWLANGSDIALLDVEMVDKNGNRCPLYKGKIDFTIDGPAIWRGGYNSGKEHSVNNKFLNLECGINRVAVRSTLQPGPVSIVAKHDGFATTTAKLTSHYVANDSGVSLQMPPVSMVTPVEEPYPVSTPKIPPYVHRKENSSLLISKFSYTGDAQAKLRSNVFWGKKAFTDVNYNYTVIPKYLVGAEYVRMPNSDSRYWARDQLQFVANENISVFVGHDDRVTLPTFIREQYEDTGDDFQLGKVTMSLFKKNVEKGERVIMAGNSDGEIDEKCRMYVVFMKQDHSSQTN